MVVGPNAFHTIPATTSAATTASAIHASRRLVMMPSNAVHSHKHCRNRLDVILRSAPKARVSKDGSKLRACFHPSRRPHANACGLLRMTASFAALGSSVLLQRQSAHARSAAVFFPRAVARALGERLAPAGLIEEVAGVGLVDQAGRRK